jgi:hypothetical protein
MAKPAASFKRENEKRKLAKRLEKQKKKVERKNNPKEKGFDNMLAYVDENGMIVDALPDDSASVSE